MSKFKFKYGDKVRIKKNVPAIHDTWDKQKFFEGAEGHVYGASTTEGRPWYFVELKYSKETFHEFDLELVDDKT